MKRSSAVIGMAMLLAIALWTFCPAQSFAQRASKTSIKGAAGATGVVIGKPVRNEKGDILGKVENIVLSDNGCAKYVILSGKFSRGRAKLYPIPWAVIVRSGPDAIFVRLDSAILMEAPSFEMRNWPDLTQSQWETRITTFYQTKAQMTVPERPGQVEPGKTPGTMRPEEKTNPGADVKRGLTTPEKKPAEAVPSPKETEKGKAGPEKERGLKEPEMKQEKGSVGDVPGAKKKEKDIKPGLQQTEPKKREITPGSSEMKKPEQPEKMERGSSQMERGRPETTERAKPEKGMGSGQSGATVQPGQIDEKQK